MIPEVGQRVGPYEILGRLGAGGMGLVFRAWDGRLHREVAVKMLHADLTMPRLRERFLREARAASALSHAHICTIFDIGEQNGELYLVMELLEGETLKERVVRGALSPEELIRYGSEVASALETAHLKGIVHRDIKPANIFLVDGFNDRCQTKVLDFGLAKVGAGISGRSRGLDLTSEGATVGTVAYMSPEQARGEPLDARSDLFSLGVVLYEMATGHVPFKGNTSAMVFVQLLEHSPEPMRTWTDGIPRELERIIFKLLQKDRANRFQSGRELEEAFNKLAQDKSLLQKKPGRVAKAVASFIPQAMPPAPAPAVEPVAEEPELPALGGDPQIPDRRTFRRFDSRGASGSRGERFQDRRAPGPSKGHSPERRVAPAVPRDPYPGPPLPVSPPQSAGHQPSDGVLRPVPRLPTVSSRSGPREPMNEDLHQPMPGINVRSAQQVLREIEAARQVRMQPGSRPGGAVREPSEQERAPSAASRQSGQGVEEGARARDFGSTLFSTSVETADAAPSRRRIWLVAGVTLVVAMIAAGVFFSGVLRPAVANTRGGLLMTVIDNRTGDNSLDGAVMAGLRLKLEQSRYLSMLGWDAFPEALRELSIDPAEGVSETMALRAAQRINAPMFLYGRIQGAREGSGAPYTITLEVIDARTNEKMTPVVTTQDTMASRQQLGDSIDRLATAIRSGLGESGDSITRADVPLAQQGTVNPDALSAFALGQQQLNEGHRPQALTYFQRAAADEPKFIQAQLGLAAIYRKERAETAAADASRIAQAEATNTDQRTLLLTQIGYELNTSGDLLRAGDVARQLVQLYPHDAESLAMQALVFRSLGRYSDALASAEKARAEDPFCRDASVEAEYAMLALDRYDSLLDLESKEQLSQRHGGISLLAAYAAGQESAIAAQLTNINSVAQSSQRASDYAAYLDNTGALTAGELQWKTASANAESDPSLASRAYFLMAQGALNRSLAGECSSALDMARRSTNRLAGPVATFNAGMAQAFCGELNGAAAAAHTLEQQYAQNTMVSGYLLADLRGAILLQQGNAAAALDTLKRAEANDQVSLTPYLRGLANLALKHKNAVADFQAVLSHRGIELMLGNDVYPMGQFQLAQAFAMTGDNVSSAAAYKRFLELWRDGDPNGALIAEANAHLAPAP